MVRPICHPYPSHQHYIIVLLGRLLVILNIFNVRVQKISRNISTSTSLSVSVSLSALTIFLRRRLLGFAPVCEFGVFEFPTNAVVFGFFQAAGLVASSAGALMVFRQMKPCSQPTLAHSCVLQLSGIPRINCQPSGHLRR